MWVSVDTQDVWDESRLVVAATSYAGRDLYYINLWKLVPIGEDWQIGQTFGAQHDVNLKDIKLELWKEKVALLRKDEIPSFSFGGGMMMWVDRSTKTVQMEKFCAEY
jgi:hypothetical protein